jgi:glycosyltransferase involved in cell wall biosynthesis
VGKKSDTKDGILISVVAPAYNEEDGIIDFIESVTDVVSSLTMDFEIVIVDDGSKDATLARLLEAKLSNSSLRIISAGNNIGHMRALEAGMKSARGQFIITLDSDFQDEPNDIGIVWSHARELELQGIDFDVVQTFRKNRESDSSFKRISAILFYKLISKISNVNIVESAADFRLIKRSALDFLLMSESATKVFRFMIPSAGLKVHYVAVTRHERKNGSSEYSLSKMIHLALTSIISFSTFPLRVIFGLAVSCNVVSMIVLPSLLWIKLTGRTTPGWVSIVAVQLVLSSIVLTSLGVISLYVAKILDQILGNPYVRVREL